MGGSSVPLIGGGGAKETRAQQRLADIRSAKVVVATAGAFEFATRKVNSNHSLSKLETKAISIENR